MDANDLRKLFQKSSDKFAIFADLELLKQYEMDTRDLLNLINDFLTDQEKARLFELPHFKKLNGRGSILKLIRDNTVLLEMFNNEDIMSLFENYDIKQVVNSLECESKIQVLHNPDFLKAHKFTPYDVAKLINSLPAESKKDLLTDRNLLEHKLELSQYYIGEIIISLESEEDRLNMIDIYEYTGFERGQILKSFSDESKVNILLGNKYSFDKDEMRGIISSLSTDSLVDFFRNRKEILLEKNIKPYDIIRFIDTNKQLDFVSRIEETGLSIEERRAIFATLSRETKDQIDTTNLPQEYITVMELELNEDSTNFGAFGKFIVELDDNPEKYRGLDELLYINPMESPEQNRQQLLQLLEICPNAKISDNIGLNPSTIEEYKSGEAWIESVLQQIDESWTNIQKVAFIDNAIGKRISYTPDFDTEVCNQGDARALWKIIHSGYGVCNGIAQIEKYILDKIGIDSEMVSSGKHAFLKLKEIELPTADGGKVVGDTILDPTWNLTAHRYGAKPENFCKSYEEIRKNDIKSDGTDSEAHKNDKDLASATLTLDEQSLRNIFTSIGVADKDGSFPAKKFIEISSAIDEFGFSTEEMIEKQFLLLSKWNPDFAMCQNSTSAILQTVLLNQKNLHTNRCVVNRVYEKNDESKRPLLYVYADLGAGQEKFYFADKETKQFAELPKEEFVKRFECYEMDMEKQNGQRPWEISGRKENIEDLTRSSGKVVAGESEER